MGNCTQTLAKAPTVVKGEPVLCPPTMAPSIALEKLYINFSSSLISEEMIGQLPWWTAELRAKEEAHGHLMAVCTDSGRLAAEARGAKLDSSLTYGEIPFRCLAHILLHPALEGGSHFFYDLGSGVGRAVFAAYYLRDFQGCIGVEYVADLHEMAEKALHHMQTWAPSWKGASPPLPGRITFHLGDITAADMVWCQSTGIVYMCSLCFSEELWAEVVKLCLQLPSGAILVTLRQHPSFVQESWKLVYQALYEMSWGAACVYVYKVLRDPCVGSQARS